MGDYEQELNMTEQEMIELEKYWCENCCNFDRENVLPDGYSNCKASNMLTYSECSGKECKFFNVPAGNVVVLPCKLGDKVWYISTENPFVAFEKELKPREDPTPIAGILITADGVYVSTDNIGTVIDLCDKVNTDYAYLSEAEADKALQVTDK